MSYDTYEKSGWLSQPYELYRFTHAGDTHAFTTKTKQLLHVDGTIYQPAFLKRGSITRTEDPNKQKLSITVSADNPVAQLFKRGLPGREITLKIIRVQKAAAGDPGINLWSGQVTSANFNDDKCSLECEPVAALMNKAALRMYYQFQCNHNLFDELCSLDVNDWSEYHAVSAIEQNGTLLTLNTITQPDGYYAAGLAEINDQWVMVTGHDAATNKVLILSALDGLKEGDVIRLTKGCDRTKAACNSFGNKDNFFGFQTIPTDNPFIDGI
ncbi:phage BR0599 family protein [Pseudomonas sp. TYF_14]|uniref:baseplate hub domain-containing protein n=1 Tax=Pseudomonas sp. TYF_14 TaxID=3367193 RepID=UPI00370AF04D